VAYQALVASQLGLALGQRVSERFRERAEQLAAVVSWHDRQPPVPHLFA
jgi:hypothetical protein